MARLKGRKEGTREPKAKDLDIERLIQERVEKSKEKMHGYLKDKQIVTKERFGDVLLAVGGVTTDELAAEMELAGGIMVKELEAELDLVGAVRDIFLRYLLMRSPDAFLP